MDIKPSGTSLAWDMSRPLKFKRQSINKPQNHENRPIYTKSESQPHGRFQSLLSPANGGFPERCSALRGVSAIFTRRAVAHRFF
jgi:hypothetical protein